MSLVIGKVEVALTVIGLCGIILSFVPFANGITPLPDVLLDWDFSDPLWLLAAPCIILPVPISAAYIFRLFNGRVPFWAGLTSYVLSGWLVVSCLVALAGDANDLDSILLLFLFGAAFIGAVWFSIQGVRRDSMVRGLVLMQGVYIAPMTFFVVGFGVADGLDYMEPGVPLGAVTLLAYLTQIALSAKRFVWVTAVVVPMTCIAVFLAADNMPL